MLSSTSNDYMEAHLHEGDVQQRSIYTAAGRWISAKVMNCISEIFGGLVPQISPFHRVEKVFTERINAQSLVRAISIPLVGQIFGGGSDYMCLIFLFI